MSVAAVAEKPIVAAAVPWLGSLSTRTSLLINIGRVHRDNFGVCGSEKIWRQFNREAPGLALIGWPDSWTSWTSRASCMGNASGSTTWPAELDTRLANLGSRHSDS